MKFLKRLLLLLIIFSIWGIRSQAQITPQWKAVTGGLMSYFYPGKSPIGFDTLLNAQTIRSRGTGYLGEWTSAKAATGFYNKVGSLISYNNVMYAIISNPGTNPPTNTNGGAPYYEPYNPAGKRSIKIMSLAGGVNAYSILSLYEPTTLQAYVKMNLVVGENVSGNFIEAQSIDANLSNIDHLTPLAWYTVNPKTFKSNLDTTLLSNRTVLVQVRYNPAVSGFGTLEVRYKSNYGTGRYPNGIFVKSSTLSNRDMFHLDSTYTITGTFPVIEPSSTEYLNQIYDANGLKYIKEGGVSFLPKGGAGITIGADSSINLGGNTNSDTEISLVGFDETNNRLLIHGRPDVGGIVTDDPDNRYNSSISKFGINLESFYRNPDLNGFGNYINFGLNNLTIGNNTSSVINGQQLKFSTNNSANNFAPILLRDPLRKGFLYNWDDDSNLSDSSLVPKRYVTHYADSVARSTITASKGLTKVGTDIQLGGTLTGPVTINSDGANSYTHTLLDNASSPTGAVQLLLTNSGGTSAGVAGIDLTNSDSYAISASPTSALIRGPRQSLQLLANTTVFTDNTINRKGIEYAANYNGTLGINSLIPKRMLDSVSATKLDTTGKSLNAKRDFGAVGNSKVLTDVVTTAGSNIITSASANFTSADIGKTIGIAYGGPDTLTNAIRRPFKATIIGVPDANTFTLSANVTATIAGPRTITGVSMTALSNTVTCSGCTMTANDKGKQVIIPGVGPINNQNASHSTGTFPIDSNSTCYIYAITNSTTFLVSKKALYTTSNRSVTIPGASVVYGSDDTAPLQNAINSAINSHKKLEIPEGKYLTTAQITAGSNLTMEGSGAGSTIIYPLGSGFSGLVANHSASDTITRNIHFRYFEMDCMWLGTNLYSAINKAIFVLPVIDFSLEYVTIRNSSATGFGSDFMKNYLLLGNKFVHNGRQGFEFQSIYTIPGGAGAGIGTGKWQDEGGSAISNYADNNFSNGLFWEGQERGQFTGGAKVSNNFTTFNNGNGIGDIGTDGSIISNNYSIYDGVGIRSDQSPYQTASNLTYAKNGEYSGNIVRNSFGTLGVFITKYGGQKITNNTFENTLAMGSTAGVKLISQDTTGNNIREIIFQSNKIKGIRGDGLSIETGNSSETHGSVIVTENTLVNNGLSNASPGAGIVLKAKTLNFVNRGNIAYDDRLTTSRTQGYGFYVPAAQTTTAFYYGENSFFNNTVAADLYTNLTPTSWNIGQPLIKNVGPTPLTIWRNGTSLNSTIEVRDDGSSVFMGKSSVAGFWGVGNTADINGAGTLFVNTINGRVGIGQNTPTAALHIKAGTSSASTAPIKLTSGTNLTAAEAGAIEFDGTDLFYTTSTPTRRTVANLVGTQTFTNKTLTSPQINTPLLNTTSVAGQVWTATNTAGAGTWTALPGPASLIVGTPTIAAGAGAGTTPTVSITSNGRSLQVTVTTGTLPTGTNAVIATVTLANALSYTPYPVFSSPPGAATLLNGASMIGMSSSGPSNVTITSGTTALVAATTYVWNITL